MGHDRDHAARHKAGGGDAIKLDEFDTPSAGADLDAQVGLHGLMPAADGNPDHVYCGDMVQRVFPGLADYALLQEEQLAGVDGDAFAAGDWRTRALSNKYYDPSDYVTLVAPRFSLTAGLYFVMAEAAATAVGVNRLRIWSTTRGQLLIGQNANAFAATVVGVNIDTACRAIVVGQLLLPVSEIFELQHRGASTGDFGTSVGWGDNEVYSTLQIWRLRDDSAPS